MLIHGTLCPLSGGKNGNWTTTLQPVSSVNVAALVLDQGAKPSQDMKHLTRSLLFLITSTLLITRLHVGPTPHNMWRSGVSAAQ